MNAFFKSIRGKQEKKWISLLISSESAIKGSERGFVMLGGKFGRGRKGGLLFLSDDFSNRRGEEGGGKEGRGGEGRERRSPCLAISNIHASNFEVGRGDKKGKKKKEGKGGIDNCLLHAVDQIG